MCGQRIRSLRLEFGGDQAQHFDKVSAGAAAGVEHDDVGVGEAIRQAEFALQHGIHPRHLVAHDFFRGVPHAQLFAQCWVECLQEGFVKVLHRMFGLEFCEECGSIHAVERVGGPVEHFHQMESL